MRSHFHPILAILRLIDWDFRDRKHLETTISGGPKLVFTAFRRHQFCKWQYRSESLTSHRSKSFWKCRASEKAQYSMQVSAPDERSHAGTRHITTRRCHPKGWSRRTDSTPTINFRQKSSDVASQISRNYQMKWRWFHQSTKVITFFFKEKNRLRELLNT